MRYVIFILLSCFMLSNLGVTQETDPASFKTLKQRYLISLKDNPNNIVEDPLDIPTFTNATPRISKIIAGLKKDEMLGDPDIRERLNYIKKYHPLSHARFYATNALSNNGQLPILDVKNMTEINRDRGYCTSDSVGAKPLPTLPEELRNQLTPIQQVLKMNSEGLSIESGEKIENVFISAESVSEGWLVGYGIVQKNVRLGLGLHYVPKNESLPTQYLMQGTIHAIMPRQNKSFFVFSTKDSRNQFKQCDVPLIISVVTEYAPSKFEITPYRILPSETKLIYQLDNKDLFISFGGPKHEGCRWGSMPIERSDYQNNPPIGFTPKGEIYDICKQDSPKF